MRRVHELSEQERIRRFRWCAAPGLAAYAFALYAVAADIRWPSRDSWIWIAIGCIPVALYLASKVAWRSDGGAGRGFWPAWISMALLSVGCAWTGDQMLRALVLGLVLGMAVGLPFTTFTNTLAK